jgi:4'-phosphopantetheinyl transferase
VHLERGCLPLPDSYLSFMPLIHYFTAPHHSRIGIWRIEEDAAFFRKKLPLNKQEQLELVEYAPKRQLEWLAGRYLIYTMTGRFLSVKKDEDGKPYLSNSAYHISLSHSGSLVTAIISPCIVGIDIQSITSKLENVAHRVFNKRKMDQLKDETRLEHLHVYWGAKEALYKAYGKRGLDFRENLLVEPFEYRYTEGVTEGVIVKEDWTMSFTIFYKKINNYILVYAIQDIV